VTRATVVHGLRYAWYGDDFTGATDTLATLAEGGQRALLFLGVPQARHLAAAGPLDALGIAGVARALDPAAMAAELKPVARFFATLRAPLLHYKCCSTFDSAPGVGNLATALRLFGRAAQQPLVPVVGGQPGLGRYCVFGHLYAAAGQGGEVHRIDRHPTMSRHPVTPMHESDLRRHLASQGLDDVALVDWRAYGAGAAAFDAEVERQLADRPEAVLFDVLDEPHLRTLGGWLWRRAAAGSLLVLGASSVAEALLAHWRADAAPRDAAAPRIAPADGPVFVLAGSQSPVTARQIERAGAAYRAVAIDAARLVAEPAHLEATAEACAAALRDGRSVLAHTGAVQAGGPVATAVAAAGARLLVEVVRRVPPLRRVGVAGGDTSSHALRALGPWALGCIGRLAHGVPLVRAHADDVRLDGLELMLKGGQMGPPDLFETLRSGT
jgi:uncharacterized protein YgbK (DUF1537 family)